MLLDVQHTLGTLCAWNGGQRKEGALGTVLVSGTEGTQ